MPNQSDILKQQLFKSLALPWQDILPESRIETILEEKEIRYRKRLYSRLGDPLGHGVSSVVREAKVCVTRSNGFANG